MSRSQPQWPSLKAENQAIIIADLMGMRNLKAAGRLADFAAAWRSCLLVTGLVCRKKGSHAWALSLGHLHGSLSVPL